MIGVIAKPEEYELVCEFFELFKTPWEYYRPEGQYSVVLSAREDASMQAVAANLVVVYGGRITSFDKEAKFETMSQRIGGTLSYKGSQLPLYNNNLAFGSDGISFLVDGESNQSVGLLSKSGCQTIARIGYDLFQELRILLTDGQPLKNAAIPTLEMHIALLRDLIVECGIPLVEVPATPENHSFIACLTHDVDHPAIRWHRFDHTMFGFVYRALVGSVLDVVRGRLSARYLFKNWMAAAKLPFIYLGLAKDFWYGFDHYLEIEKNLDSTFFVLPFKDRPGKLATGLAPQIRASKYGAADIGERVKKFVLAGREVGLHGIDAWIDPAMGQEEKIQITKTTGVKNVGVRMHWLYFDKNSPVALESAGFTYDSTVGYNETIGYRAGTTQAYRPSQVRELLELPLHVMDTALFYPDYLNLTVEKAEKLVRCFIETTCQYGGVLTINWHDRSLAPERLWGECYVHLVDEFKRRGAWCASAGRTVAWFKKRRSITFYKTHGSIEVHVPVLSNDTGDRTPNLKVRVHNQKCPPAHSSRTANEYVLTKTMSIPLGCQV